MNDPQSWQEALKAWRQLLGEQYVIVDDYPRYAAQTATYATAQRVPAILYPADRQAVQACLQVANQFELPVYPTSRGKNWGYGSRVPPRDNSVVLDLSRMNRIIDCDETLCCVTLEPGVTYQQLIDYLQTRRLPLLPNLPGSTGLGSPLANAVDRGVGMFGDSWQKVIGLEVVLPTGECIQSGFQLGETRPQPGAAAGPIIDGLFSQSNLGVVTRITLELEPTSDHFQHFNLDVDDPDTMTAVIDDLQALKARHLPLLHFRFWNDYRVLSSVTRYPWAAARERTPLPEAVFQALKADWGIERWRFYGVLPSYSAAQAALDVDTLRTTLQAPGTRLNLRPTLLTSQEHLQIAYWRKRTAAEHYQLEREGCGVILYMLSVPFIGKSVIEAQTIVCDVVHQHGLEPFITCMMVSVRELHMGCFIVFDREIPGEDENALRCLAALDQAASNARFRAHRVSTTLQADMRREEAYQAVLTRLKAALDPQRILAPGRYGV